MATTTLLLLLWPAKVYVGSLRISAQAAAISATGTSPLDPLKKTVLTYAAGADRLGMILGTVKPFPTLLLAAEKKVHPCPKLDKQPKEAINKAVAMIFFIYVVFMVTRI